MYKKLISKQYKYLSFIYTNMSIQSYQIEKSDEEIRRTVLVNLISMLSERCILKRENIEKNTNTIIV